MAQGSATRPIPKAGLRLTAVFFQGAPVASGSSRAYEVAGVCSGAAYDGASNRPGALELTSGFDASCAAACKEVVALADAALHSRGLRICQDSSSTLTLRGN